MFSNASLHWCDDVASLLPRLLGRVRPGGALALQMPDMRGQPSHTLFRETAEELGLASGSIRLPSSEMDAADYAERLLGPLCAELDMWNTSYVHTLRGEDAVFRFVRSTYDGHQALRQSRGREDADDGIAAAAAQAFEERYREKVGLAYPPGRAGVTLYPFSRFFLVARRPTVLEALQPAYR